VDVWTAVWWVLKHGTLITVSILKDIFFRDGKARRKKR
jgi:hypothetical protein